jgi:hypothetical protein
MRKDWKMGPLVHSPWRCPYKPPAEMLVQEDDPSLEKRKKAWEVAARFCILEHRCKMGCARTRVCLEGILGAQGNP